MVHTPIVFPPEKVLTSCSFFIFSVLTIFLFLPHLFFWKWIHAWMKCNVCFSCEKKRDALEGEKWYKCSLTLKIPKNITTTITRGRKEGSHSLWRKESNKSFFLLSLSLLTSLLRFSVQRQRNFKCLILDDRLRHFLILECLLSYSLTVILSSSVPLVGCWEMKILAFLYVEY